MDVRVVRVVQHDGPDVADAGPHARLPQLAHVAREVRARRPRQQRPVGVEGRDQGLRRLQERLRVDAGERAAPLRAAERLRAAQEGRRRLVVLPVDRRAGRVEAAQQHCDYCDARDHEAAAARRGFAGFAVFVAAVRRAVAVLCCRRPVRAPPHRCGRRCAPSHVVISAPTIAVSCAAVQCLQ